MTKLLYFAWVRERIGVAEEEIALPTSLATVDDLLDWLGNRSPGHAAALADRAVIRVGVDQDFARGDARIAGAREIAIFPPVTGGDHDFTLPSGEGRRDDAERGGPGVGRHERSSSAIEKPTPGPRQAARLSPLPGGEGEVGLRRLSSPSPPGEAGERGGSGWGPRSRKCPPVDASLPHVPPRSRFASAHRGGGSRK